MANFSFVQVTIGPQLAADPLQAVFTAPNTRGNVIVIVAFAITGGLTSIQGVSPDISDTNGNPYYFVQGAAEFGAIGLYVAPNIKGGANTVTCIPGLGIVALEYSSAISPFFVCPGSALVGNPPPSINNDNTEPIGHGANPLFFSSEECLVIWGREINGSNGTWTATSGAVRYSGLCPGDAGGFGTAAGDDIAANVAVTYANTILVNGSVNGFGTCIFFNLDNLSCGGGTGGVKMGLPSITCASPPSGIVGAAYSHSFPAQFGNTPYSFSIISGALPNGLNLDAATGIVSGTPTAGGTFGFSIQVTDSGTVPGTAAVGCSIVISAGLPVAIPLMEFRGVKRFRLECE